jgi:hypothetical protein
MHLLAWARLMVARHPWVYWLAIAVVAGAVALTSASAIARVEAARRSWGEQATVWMTTSAIEPGQPITATEHAVPIAVVPPGAVPDIPVGTVALQRIGAGEIVTSTDVAANAPAGLIPPGWVAFAVPASGDHLSTGDHVDVYAADQFIDAGLVVDVGESESMIAIPTTAAPAMAAALLADAVTLALSPGP